MREINIYLIKLSQLITSAFEAIVNLGALTVFHLTKYEKLYGKMLLYCYQKASLCIQDSGNIPNIGNILIEYLSKNRIINLFTFASNRSIFSIRNTSQRS